MMRQLNPSISIFNDFNKQLISFVNSGNNCKSAQARKEYESWYENETNYMSGADRQLESKCSQQIKEVYRAIKQVADITTIALAPFVGRHQSTLRAFMCMWCSYNLNS